MPLGLALSRAHTFRRFWNTCLFRFGRGHLRVALLPKFMLLSILNKLLYDGVFSLKRRLRLHLCLCSFARLLVLEKFRALMVQAFGTSQVLDEQLRQKLSPFWLDLVLRLLCLHVHM